MMIQYGVCNKCDKWGEAPKEFNETKHILKCKCGELMYLQRHNPKEAGYKDRDKIEISFVKQ